MKQIEATDRVMDLDPVNIEELRTLLPEGYEDACYETNAITRKRTIKSPDELLILNMHYLEGHSLIETAQLAKMHGLGKISDVGFMKRFVKCGKWFEWMTEHVLPMPIVNYEKPSFLSRFENVVAVDASDVQTTGKVPEKFHLHYMTNLFTFSCEQYVLTDEKTGESLRNFELQSGDLTIGDRGYGTITGIEYCKESCADFILRIRNNAFNLYDENGEKVQLTDWLKDVGESAQDRIFYYKNKGEFHPIRFCAVRRSEEDIEAELKRIDKKAKKRQRKISEDTKLAHEYIFVVTSISAEEATAEEILSVYRLRWQVELVFKRLKSLLGLGSIPTKTPESTRVWLEGKMLMALLIEKMIGDVDFSPSGRRPDEPQRLEGDETGIVYSDPSHSASKTAVQV